MKVNLNVPVKNLEGKNMKAVEGLDELANLGKLIGNALSMFDDKRGNSMKYWQWAQKLFKGDPFELDDTDYEIFKGVIEQLPLPVMYKGQALQIAVAAKAKEDAGKK